MKKFLLASTVTMLVSTSSIGKEDQPSARRLWLACFQEQDPGCSRMVADAMWAAYADPVLDSKKYDVPNPKNVNLSYLLYEFMRQRNNPHSAREMMIDLMISSYVPPQPVRRHIP